MNYKQYTNFHVDVHKYLLKTYLPHMDNNDQNKVLEILYYGLQTFLYNTSMGHENDTSTPVLILKNK
jgi:hypothetical protein